MAERKTRYSAFTIRYPRVVKVLDCLLKLSAVDNDSEFEVLGFWDTGASFSVITKSLAEEIKAKIVGHTKIRGITGASHVLEYAVDVHLPNNITINDLVVSESSDLGNGSNGRPYNFLIGMDIIHRGDLAINHSDGYTTMSFRIPSISSVDYVEEHRLDFPSESSE